MEDKKAQARSAAFEAIAKYLEAAGWTFGGDQMEFQWIDPLTIQAHRSDFAFFIQSERDMLDFIRAKA